MAQGKTSTTKSVALIVSSVRPGRNGPKMAKLVTESIQKNLPTDVVLKVIDLQDWNLPVFTESEIPFTVKSWEDYSSETSRNWSREISSHDAYIFMVPEYNNSYAGSLKSAFDYLYNEWMNKPAMIVNYGARPADMLFGGKHFRDILSIFQMKLPANTPRISISTMDREKTAAGEDLVFYDANVEQQVRADVSAAWEETLKHVLAPSPASA
ncbi:hypothetical protein H072_10038 [Dactylellina haptotyla CBS 200.50]|uniref:NADPH-dependent FMN reductase-like domain-containing protein n=1 Tax=Dactylellina haptotyla (strain CBS 200.50) TaxID=1284197 RepID=S8A5Q1_DACHA|nr:hypothetical protein H072_10038 [Dactylellina haptotyla CBS 200.50]